MTFGRIENLLRGRAERHIPDGTVRVVVARDDMQAQMIWDLLTEQITHGWDQRIEYPGANPHDLFGPTLVGAWAGDDLVGGAFVMPDEQDAEQYRLTIGDQGAQIIERYCVMIQGIATLPQHRGKGIGTHLKDFCELWARQHDALLILSIPTTDQAHALNRRCGYHVLAPLVTLVIQPGHADTGLTPIGLPFTRQTPEARWAFKILGQSTRPAIRVGQALQSDIPRRGHQQATVEWLDHT